MKLKPSLPSSNSGYTVMEFMVAIGLSMVVSAIALSNFQSTQNMVRFDIERTSLNQNLRSALDIIGINVRLAGENLPGFFPAIVVEDNGTSDVLIIRRSIIDESLMSCQAISQGTSNPIVFADVTSSETLCSYSNKADIFNAWSAYRTSEGGSGLAYIYDRVLLHGEWFQWSEEVDSGSLMSISPAVDVWEEDYTALHSFAYVLEEWRFELVGDTLQMIIDNDTANPINVVNGLTGFEVTLRLADDSTVSEFAPGDMWSNVALVQVSLSGEETSGNRTIPRTMNGSFFPRNVLSG